MKYVRHVLSFVLTISFAVVLAGSALAETRIASWNVKRLGHGSQDFEALARVISHFDFIGLQEVMEEAALMDLVSNLQEMTGSEWGVMSSHAIGRGSYKERYAFLWRKSHVEFVDGAVVYLDSRDVFAREPLSARFRTSEGETFIAANIHVLYGDSKSDRIPEINALLSYWSWLGESFPEEQYFLMGDFNMAPHENSFDLLKAVAAPIITEGATTLSTKNGQYANLYDNIWVPNNLEADLQSGIFPLASYLKRSNKSIRDDVSDHAPVYMILSDMDETSGMYDPSAVPEIAPQEPTSTALVRGNGSSKIYHMPDCANYEDMLHSSNLVEFASEAQAIADGFRAARNCY